MIAVRARLFVIFVPAALRTGFGAESVYLNNVIFCQKYSFGVCYLYWIFYLIFEGHNTEIQILYFDVNTLGLLDILLEDIHLVIC